MYDDLPWARKKCLLFRGGHYSEGQTFKLFYLIKIFHQKEDGLLTNAIQ